jgi:spermidine/putrescine transport system ATP-binding protein
LSEFAVEVKNVTKNFGDVVAVLEANLSVEQREFFSLLGPSGSGKTTLLRLIAGFETPTSGKMFIAGRDVSKLPPHQRPVNTVFQNYALFPHLNVFENVAFGLRTKRSIKQAEISERVKAALAMVRLPDMGERMPAQLSGGQKQRIALARAIVNEPQVLLLDEPLSALDPQIREEMQEELRRLHKQLGICFIMVTHDQAEALALSTRIAVVSQGTIEQVGSAKEVYELPSSSFVAQFIGNTNVIPAIIKDSDNTQLTVKIAGLPNLKIAKPTAFGNVGEAIKICVKPHAIKVFSESESGLLHTNQGYACTLEAHLMAKSFKGMLFEYLVETSSGLRLRATTSSDLSAQDGDKVYAAIKAEDLRVLPAREKGLAALAPSASASRDDDRTKGTGNGR